LNKLSTHRWVDVIICHTGSRASRWFAIVDVSACFHVAASSGNVRIAYQVVGQGPLDLVFLEVHWEDAGYSHLLRRLAALPRLILFEPSPSTSAQISFAFRD
jgi:hypothetical protein